MAQTEIWLLVGLLGVAIPLVAIARRLNLSYPIVLVLGGLVMGFIPRLPQIRLEPDLVLVIFLPPLLYWEAITAPTDVMRANAARIWVVAIGLVLATTVAVAVVAHNVIPDLSWPMAFVLGAVVAPTDELASVPVLERMRIPRHLIAIIEGESLLNDASALILYGAALRAATTGAFDPRQTVLQFLLAGFGGIAIGMAIGRLAVEGWRRIGDPQLQGVISFVLPFLTYASAEQLGLSGVLAVVFAATHVNRSAPVVLAPTSRLQLTGFWDTVVFLANALLFLLVGLQLHELARAVLAEYSWQAIAWYALLVNATVIAIRFAWILLQQFAPVIGGASEHRGADWKHAVVAAWSGLRGGVSLAAALAIPVAVASGAHLVHRNLVIFLVLTVILVTLVGGGVTLPLVLRWLDLSGGRDEEWEDLRRGLLAMSAAAVGRLDQLEGEGRITADHATHLRRHYELRDRLDLPADSDAPGLVDAERQVLAAERAALIDMSRRRQIDNAVLRRLQRSLDIAEERLASWEPTRGDDDRLGD